MGLHQRGILPRCVSRIGSSGCRGFCRVLDPFSGGFAGQGTTKGGTSPPEIRIASEGTLRSIGQLWAGSFAFCCGGPKTVIIILVLPSNHKWGVIEWLSNGLKFNPLAFHVLLPEGGLTPQFSNLSSTDRLETKRMAFTRTP